MVFHLRITEGPTIRGLKWRCSSFLFDYDLIGAVKEYLASSRCTLTCFTLGLTVRDPPLSSERIFSPHESNVVVELIVYS
jgi:hypothetical protein